MTPSQLCANVFNYYVGDTKNLSFKALYAKGLAPLDLTNCTNITIFLPNADGTFTQIDFDTGVSIVSPALLGGAEAVIDADVWPTPNVGVGQDLLVTYLISGAPTTVKFAGALNVYQNDQ